MLTVCVGTSSSEPTISGHQFDSINDVKVMIAHICELEDSFRVRLGLINTVINPIVGVEVDPYHKARRR